MKKLLLAIAVLSAAPALRAGFEGVLHMKYTTSAGGGTAKVSLSGKGVRNDTEMAAGGRPMKFSVLMLRAQPDVVFMLNDAQKSYSEMNVKEMRGRTAKHRDEGYAVKDLGKETLLGYSCRHVLVTHPDGGESELWTSKDILDYDSYARSQGGSEQAGGAGFMKALKDAGADGFPVKSIHRNGNKKGGEMTVELVKAEKKSLPDDLFQVPAGYKKVEGFGGAGAALPPETRKAMEEQMKNMSPDKKKMLEEMLKGRMK